MPLPSFLAERSPGKKEQEEERSFSPALRKEGRVALSLRSNGRSLFIRPESAQVGDVCTSVVRRQKDNSRRENSASYMIMEDLEEDETTRRVEDSRLTRK